MAQAEARIGVSGLHMRFGPTLARDGMTFTVPPAQVTGFVGPDGAGKSTTMRVILSLDAPDVGTALIGRLPYRKLLGPWAGLGLLAAWAAAALLAGWLVLQLRDA